MFQGSDHRRPLEPQIFGQGDVCEAERAAQSELLTEWQERPEEQGFATNQIEIIVVA